MNAATPSLSLPQRTTAEQRWPWLMVAAGLLAICGPTLHRLITEVWTTDANAHGPIVMSMAMWLLYRKLGPALANQQSIDTQRRMPVVGGILLTLGLLLYVIGRSQGLLAFEVGALIPILLGLSLGLFGASVTGSCWFAFIFLIFAVPLPGSLTDALTQPLKLGVSWASEHLLYWLGYPIARTGVVLHMGQFKLLVADACAGLHSLFTLEALGLFYLNMVRHESAFRNVLLAILIIPVSFTANTIRVVSLALITYHLGDEAGQGFLHGFAGMVLFLSALMLIVGIDATLRRIERWRQAPKGRRHLAATAP